MRNLADLRLADHEAARAARVLPPAAPGQVLAGSEGQARAAHSPSAVGAQEVENAGRPVTDIVQRGAAIAADFADRLQLRDHPQGVARDDEGVALAFGDRPGIGPQPLRHQAARIAIGQQSLPGAQQDHRHQRADDDLEQVGPDRSGRIQVDRYPPAANHAGAGTTPAPPSSPSSASNRRRASRPRAIRLLTVPIAQPVISAASS